MGDWRVVRIGYGRYDDGGYRLWSCSGQQEHGGDDCLRDNNSTTGVKRSASQRSHRFHSLCRGGRSAVFFVLMPFVSTASSRSKKEAERRNWSTTGQSTEYSPPNQQKHPTLFFRYHS